MSKRMLRGAMAGLFLLGSVGLGACRRPTEPNATSPAGEPAPGTTPEGNQGTRADETRTAEPTEAQNGNGNGNGARMPAAEAQQARRVLTELRQHNAKEIEAGKLASMRAQSENVREFGQRLVQDHQEADKKIIEFAREHNLMLGPTAEADSAEQPDRAARQPEQMGNGTPQGAAEGNNERYGRQPGQANETGRPTTEPRPTEADQQRQRDQRQAEGQLLTPQDQQALARLRRLRGPEFDRQFMTMMTQDHQRTLERLRSAREQAQNEDLRSLLGEIEGTIQSHHERATEITRELQAEQPGRQRQRR
jgi:predicted outer membrane protein